MGAGIKVFAVNREVCPAAYSAIRTSARQAEETLSLPPTAKLEPGTCLAAGLSAEQPSRSSAAPLRLCFSQRHCNASGRLHLEANIHWAAEMASLRLKYLFLLKSESTQNSAPSCCPLGKDVQQEGPSSIHLTLCKGWAAEKKAKLSLKSTSQFEWSPTPSLPDRFCGIHQMTQIEGLLSFWGQEWVPQAKGSCTPLLLVSHKKYRVFATNILISTSIFSIKQSTSS